MKIKIKNLKSAENEINIQDTNIFVKDLKKQIEFEQKIPFSAIKLIYNGAILDDNKTLDSYSIKENSVIIYMISKVIKKNESSILNQETNLLNNNVSTSFIENNNSISNNNNNNQNYTEQMNQLLEMGFDQSKCLSALNAAKGSTQIAIEYLYNGIPNNLSLDNLENDSIDNEINFNDNNNNNEESENENENENMNLNFDNFNLSDPNALSKIASCIKVLISHDSSLLQDVLMEIEDSNPEILDFIKQRESDFKELMTHELNEEDFKVAEELGITTNIHNHDVDYDNEDMNYNPNMDIHNNNNNNPINEITKDFNEKDRESIKNLVSLGFEELEAIQAYIAFGKNEETAANFLFNDKAN